MPLTLPICARLLQVTINDEHFQKGQLVTKQKAEQLVMVKHCFMLPLFRTTECHHAVTMANVIYNALDCQNLLTFSQTDLLLTQMTNVKETYH